LVQRGNGKPIAETPATAGKRYGRVQNIFNSR
jgi:hypothetical protein